MPRISPSTRISLGLVLLTVSILLIGDMFGLVPNRLESILDARKKISESLAVQFSSAITNRDYQFVDTSLAVLVDRNADVLSAALRSVEDGLVSQAGDHTAHWQEYSESKSTATHIQVPIFRGDSRWGSVEITFTPPEKDGLFGIGSFYSLILFMMIAGFSGYLFLLRRSLKYLDPTSVIPERVKKAFDSLAEGVLILDEKAQIILANESFLKHVGYSLENLLGRLASGFNWSYIDDRYTEKGLPWIQAMQDREKMMALPLNLETSAGKHAFMVNAMPITDDKGRVRGALATFDDITLLERRNVTLRKTLGKLEQSQRRITEKNKELEYLATRDTLTGCFNRRAFFDAFESAFAQAQEKGAPLCCLMTDIDHFKSINDRYGHTTGDRVIKIIADILKHSVRGHDVVGRYGGEEFCIFLPGAELEVATKVAERIRNSIETTREMLFTSGRPVTSSFGVTSIRHGALGTMEMVNQADMALYHAKENGRNRVEQFSTELKDKRAEPAVNPSDKVVTGGGEEGAERSNRLLNWKSNDMVTLQLQQRIRELEASVSQRTEELHHEALHDKLTGLPNQALFLDRLQQAINRSIRTKGIIAVLCLGVNRFGRVNKSLGPVVGDILIKKIAQRLEKTVRKMDSVSADSQGDQHSSVSRFGSDEFNILLSDLNSAEAASRVVQRIVQVLSRSFELGGKQYYFTVAIGVSLFPNDGETPNILVRNAVAARSHIHELDDKRDYQFYSDDLNRTVESNIRIEAELHKALESEEFLLHYQPKVEAVSGRITGLEALLRWQHPEHGIMAPGQFISTAEYIGIIDDIGEWVLRKACRQARQWVKQGLLFGRVAVNLSMLQLKRHGIVGEIMAILDETGLAPSHLDLELTESAAIADFNNSIVKLQALRDKGIGISLDDYGTGYSSLRYLKNLPVDTLKIDRSFVANIASVSSDTAIVASVVTLAHSLGLKVVAEGIETEEQHKQIVKMRCDEVQGYLFSRPVPAEKALELLQADRLDYSRLAG